MALMRHSDRRLTDKIYTDENLLGTWDAFDHLPNFSAQASQIASQMLVANGHVLAPPVTSSQNTANGGSGGARTRHKSNKHGPQNAAASQGASQAVVSPGHDLTQVVTAWPKLSAPLKAAVLAIAASVNPTGEGEAGAAAAEGGGAPVPPYLYIKDTSHE